MSTENNTSDAADAPAAPADAAAATIEPAAVPTTAEQVMRAASARIAELEAELAEMRDRWLRAEAETQNVRHRSRREVEEVRQFAVQNFARDMVEAAENLKRGLDSIPPAAAGEPEVVARLREGFASVERSVTALLERNGIRREDPVGALFDPNLHQAMAEQETIEHPPGTIIQAWSAAWTLNGRLLRPAMVVVAKAPPAELTAAAAGASPANAAAPKLNTTA
jgi:molecular chaperone GrpE